MTPPPVWRFLEIRAEKLSRSVPMSNRKPSRLAILKVRGVNLCANLIGPDDLGLPSVGAVRAHDDIVEQPFKGDPGLTVAPPFAYGGEAALGAQSPVLPPVDRIRAVDEEIS